jgi:hypothetical protein
VISFAGDIYAPPRRLVLRLWFPDGRAERVWRGHTCASKVVARAHHYALWTWLLASQAARVAARDGAELLGSPCPKLTVAA